VADRLVDEVADVGEIQDLLLAARAHRRARHADQRAGEVDVFPARCIRWKPLPSSRSAPTVPRRSTRPCVGRRTPATILSSVDFPAPFSPMTPTDSPRRT
jgi:hypothetical protein